MDMYAITAEHPLLGILRNVPLEKTIDYADAAVRGGVAFFEVALNSPHALEQITMLRKHFGDRCLVGGGTAITTERCRTAMAAARVQRIRIARCCRTAFRTSSRSMVSYSSFSTGRVLLRCYFGIGASADDAPRT